MILTSCRFTSNKHLLVGRAEQEKSFLGTTDQPSPPASRESSFFHYYQVHVSSKYHSNHTIPPHFNHRVLMTGKSMTKKRVRDHCDDDERPCLKRARLPDMRSVPPSPTDRANLETYQTSQLNLDEADEKLTEYQRLREYMDEVRSEGESSMGDDEIARLADWDWDWDWDGQQSGNWRFKGDDEVDEEHQDTPLTQYDVSDEKPGTPISEEDTQQQDCPLGHNVHLEEEREEDSQGLSPYTAQRQGWVSWTTPFRGGRWSFDLLKEISQLYR